MAYQFRDDVEKLVSEQMKTGNYKSEDDLLCDALNALAIQREDLQAINAGIADMEAGRVRPLDDVAADIRREHGFSEDAEKEV